MNQRIKAETGLQARRCAPVESGTSPWGQSLSKMIRATLMILVMLPAMGHGQTTITSGTRWMDDAGKPINCHGGGILFQDGRYYWFGEFKTADRHGHIGVSCYSSIDLGRWHFEGLCLSTAADAADDLQDGCVIERPKVLRNARTGKYVMWFHFERRGHGYGDARAAVAVSDTIAGPYRYLGSSRLNAGIWPDDFPVELRHPLIGPAKTPDDFVRRDFAGGQMSRDMTLFLDEDGSAWQISSSEENQTLHLVKLRDDFLKPAGPYQRLLVGDSNEAPAVCRHQGKYYLLTSGTTGWNPNAARLAVADRLTGPWKKSANPCVGSPQLVSVTFRSQAACFLTVAGKPGLTIYIGDRWKPSDLPDSRYIWLPVDWNDGQMVLRWRDQWQLDQ